MLKLLMMSVRNILKKLNCRDTRIFPTINTLTKIIFIAIIAITATFFVKNILAIEININNNAALQKFSQKQQAIDTGNNQEAWIDESLMSNAMSLNQAIAGTIPDSVLLGQAKWIPGGMVGFTNQSIAYLYNPPASGIQYIAQTINEFLGKPAYAKGVGISGLSGILPLWKTFRNVVYSLFSILFVALGIMIMLRVKISQQAVITIQSAIPQLITSLILVTFSYAIAGLLIDLTYFFQGFILSFLFNSKGGLNSSLFSGGINPTFTQLMNANFWDIYGLTMKALPITALTLIAGIPSGIITGLIAGLSFGIGTPIAVLIGAGAFILIFLIILILILVYTIKFFFGMIKCFINIIIKIILAPFEIGMGAIPNSKLNFSSWIWQLIANLAVFPISIIFLVLVNMIIESVNTSNLWSPPMLLGTGILGPAIGICALMMLSKLPTMIPEFIFQIKPSPLGKALGESFKEIPGRKTINEIGGYAKESGVKAGGRFIAGKFGYKSGSGTPQPGTTTTGGGGNTGNGNNPPNTP
jgi:hypothetical protein